MMEESMKLIVTDLDGTLLSDEKKVSEYNIEILNRAVKEKEIELVVASGRDIYSIKNLTKDLKIKY
jgi:HAD superfamily hydrolase (TIGR01484 family)